MKKVLSMSLLMAGALFVAVPAKATYFPGCDSALQVASEYYSDAYALMNPVNAACAEDSSSSACTAGGQMRDWYTHEAQSIQNIYYGMCEGY